MGHLAIVVKLGDLKNARQQPLIDHLDYAIVPFDGPHRIHPVA
jgi:hypothetical protein